MAQWGNGAPQGYQYPMQTGMPMQMQQPSLMAQPTGYPMMQGQQQGQPRMGNLQPQPTGYGAPSFQQPQQTGFSQFQQRPAYTGAPSFGGQAMNTGIPPVPPLPSNLGVPGQNFDMNSNRFLSPSPGPPQSFAAAPLVPQMTGFVDPRLTMISSTFMPTSQGTFQAGYGGAALQQSIAQHNQTQRGTAVQRIPWALSKMEKKQYDQIFRAWDANGSGFLDGGKAIEVFGASGLDKNDLARIWALADADDRGKLNREEFHVAMGLIYRRLNGNELPEELPAELVPTSAKSLEGTVDMIRDLLKNDTHSRATNVDSKSKVRSFYGQGSGQDTRKDGTVYRHDDDEDVPVYKSSARHVDRKAVRTGTESPQSDLAEMQRQLENAAAKIDRVSKEQAARTQEDEDLEREMEDLRHKVKRVQEDLDYVSSGARSFEKDEDRRKLERELLGLLHERLPEVQRRIDERDRRRKREKDEWVSDRDRRNQTSGRYSDRDRDYGRRDYDYERREDDKGYLRGTFDNDRDRDRDRDRGDRDRGNRYRDESDQDRYYNRDRDRYERERPRSRSPPPKPKEAEPAPRPSPSPAPPPASTSAPAAVSTKNMTPEERSAFIRAEAQRQLEERKRRLGLISPSVTPAPADNSVEERLAKEKLEAEQKAKEAERDALEREEKRKARLASERGDEPPPAAAVPAPAPPIAILAKTKKAAPPPPAPRSAMKAPVPILKKSPVPPPVVAAPPTVDPLQAREAALQKAREEREARLKELERQEREEEERYEARRKALEAKSNLSSPAPTTATTVASSPASTTSTNPFYRMAQSGGTPSTAPAPGGFNPFSRPTGAAAPAPPPAPVPIIKAPSPPPAPPPTVIASPPAPAPPAPAQSFPPASKPRPQRATRDSDDEWDSPVEKEDEDDSSDDDRTARRKLAEHLFGSVIPPTSRPDSAASNTRSATQTPAPAPVAESAPPPPPPPPPPVAFVAPIPVAPPAPAAPPPPAVAAAIPAAAIPAAVEGRSALMSSILGGARLKKTQTVDKSGVLGAGAVLGDNAPPEHILHPPKAPSPPPSPPAGNGHAHKESVDWYADLATNATSAAAPSLSNITEEPAVPAIQIHDDTPQEADPLEDIDLNTEHRVRSLYAYEGQRDEDLSFSQNAIILANPSKSGGAWWYGKSSTTGRKGFFPSSYVQLMDEVYAIALYAYEATNSDEMSFEEGQQMTIVDRSEEDWWKAEQDGQIFLVPAAYLELVSGKFQLQPVNVAAPLPTLEENPKPHDGATLQEVSESEDSDGYNTWTDSDEETEDEEQEMTESERQEERRQREIERQRVLEAAGLIVKPSAEPPKPAVNRRKSNRKSAPTRAVPAPLDQMPKKRAKERDLPPLPPDSPLPTSVKLDDAFERYEAFKTQESKTPQKKRHADPSEVGSSTSPELTSTVPSTSTTLGESKITTLLNFLGRRTPGEGGPAVLSGSRTISGPIISGPIQMSNQSRENSPAFGSSWSSLVDKEALKEIPPHERKRQEAIFELIYTESAYVRDLQLVVEVFYANMLGLLDDKAITVIFANVEDILLTNTAFLSQLEERQKECRLYIDVIGDLLETHIGAMGVYMQYCVNQGTAIKILQSLRESKPELAAKLQSLRDTDPSVRNLDLSSYLLNPMQRLTRYPLLIRQILHYTPAGKDKSQIEMALLAVETILEAINESIRDQEGSERLKQLSKNLWVGQGHLDLTAPTLFMGPRKLIKEGVVTKTKSRRRIRLVLCSDILVLLEESTGSRYRYPIPLSDVLVGEVPGGRDDLAFQLTSYPRRSAGSSISLRASSARECGTWMKAIEDASAEFRAAEKLSRRHSMTA